MRAIKIFPVLIVLVIISLFSCEKTSYNQEYLTRNVIIVVIDGARYSESWSDSTHQNIPKMGNIVSKTCVRYTQFYNNGPTYTLAGHTSITTGHYQEIDNSGNELPTYPSVFQLWNYKYSNTDSLSWIIGSKDKLEILSNTRDLWWNGFFRPLTNCGLDGLGVGSGYRDDSLTFKKALDILSTKHPRLILLSFREPDYSAHQNSWTGYLNGLKSTDEYVFRLWNFIQEDYYYKGTTTLFVTNDHGRHLDGINEGFVSHGDTCSGCRHISLLAYGPDFRKGVSTSIHRELPDISATIAELLKFDIPNSQGVVMRELFK